MANEAFRSGVESWQSLGHFNGLLIPSAEILDYARRHELMARPGLALHVLTTLVVADQMTQAIEDANCLGTGNLPINPTVTSETLVAYHATRNAAELGKQGTASPIINQFMTEHDDIEWAYLIAVTEQLPLPILNGIESLERSRGFPTKTIGPENRFQPGTIDWSVAVTQLASWSVAQGIIPLERGFEDRIRRHVNNNSSPKQLTLEELETYGDWAIQRLAELSNHIGIIPEEFHNWLRQRVQPGLSREVAQQVSDNLIRELFHRETHEDEFLPTISSYSYLARRIMNIDADQGSVDPERRRLERLLDNPARYIQRFRTLGTI